MDSPTNAPGSHLETRIRAVGHELASSGLAVLEELPGGAEADPDPEAEGESNDRRMRRIWQ